MLPSPGCVLGFFCFGGGLLIALIKLVSAQPHTHTHILTTHCRWPLGWCCNSSSTYALLQEGK